MEEVYSEMIADYSKELNALNERLARLDTIEQTVIDTETVENYLNECVLAINSPDPHIVKTVFDKLIEKVVVYDDKVELYLIVFPLKFVIHKETNGCPMYTLCITENRSAFQIRAY